MKKAIIATMLLVLLLSFAGCTDSGTSNGSQSSSQSTTTSTFAGELTPDDNVSDDMLDGILSDSMLSPSDDGVARARGYVPYDSNGVYGAQSSTSSSARSAQGSGTQSSNRSSQKNRQSGSSVTDLATLIGARNEELSGSMGKGRDSYETVGGKRTLTGREYSCDLLGSKVSATVSLDDKGMVERIKLAPGTGSVSSWKSKLEKELGKPDTISRNGNGYDYCAAWNVSSSRVVLTETGGKVGIELS